MTFEQARLKLLEDWPEDLIERKKRIKELSDILVFECEATRLQYKVLGMSDHEIRVMAIDQAKTNIEGLLSNPNIVQKRDK